MYGCVQLCFAQEKKYPPYPDVWGYELPWPKQSQVFVYRMPNGDFAITYKQDRNVGNKYIVKYFFSGNEMYLTKEEVNEFKERVRIGGGNKVTLKGGETIQVSQYGECKNAFTDYYFYETDAKGQVIFKKMAFYLHDKAKTVPLIDLYDLRKCGGHGVLSMMIENTGESFEALGDGGFLFFSMNGGFIIRFGKSFKTKSELINKKVFLVDRDFFMKRFYKKQKFSNTAEPYQALHDALLKHILTIKSAADKSGK